MNKNIIYALVVIVLILGGAYVFATRPAGAPTKSVDPVVPLGKTVTFNLTARQFQFEPAVLNVAKGDNVVINITSADVTHGFAIDEYNINETVTPGQTTQIKFVADKVGTFIFRCTVPCGPGHKDMKGQVIVAG